MTLTNIKKTKAERGFTIVELLIVIVIIGILAAITIIAYNGITQRAHASSAKAAAQNVAAKAEAYNAENGAYPANFSNLTTASSTASWYLPSNAITLPGTAGALTSAPSSDNTVEWQTCSNGGIVGLKVFYWDFTNSNFNSYITAGATSGTGVTCSTTYTNS